MAYAIYDFSETINRLITEEHGFNKDDIETVLSAWGIEGDYAEWVGGFILHLKDGRFAYVSGWCDTTGWGCQDDIDVTIMPRAILKTAQLIKEHHPYEQVPEPNQWDDEPPDLIRYLAGEINDLGNCV